MIRVFRTIDLALIQDIDDAKQILLHQERCMKTFSFFHEEYLIGCFGFYRFPPIISIWAVRTMYNAQRYKLSIVRESIKFIRDLCEKYPSDKIYVFIEKGYEKLAHLLGFSFSCNYENNLSLFSLKPSKTRSS